MPLWLTGKVGIILYLHLFLLGINLFATLGIGLGLSILAYHRPSKIRLIFENS